MGWLRVVLDIGGWRYVIVGGGFRLYFVLAGVVVGVWGRFLVAEGGWSHE